MDFSEALRIVKQGGKVKRKFWSTDPHICLEDGVIVIRSSYNCSYSFRPDENELMASDWEVYKDWFGTYDNEKGLALEHINEFEDAINAEILRLKQKLNVI